MKLNVGCGQNKLEGWINIDRENADVNFDLEECRYDKMPFNDNVMSEFLLSHVIEHIKDPLSLMQELHRIAEPDAKMIIRVPYGSSDDAFEDPTHVRQYFVGSFDYFAQPTYWRADYGYRGDWQAEKLTLRIIPNLVLREDLLELIMTRRNVVTEMVAELKAIKPIRAMDKTLRFRPNFNIESI